MVPELPLAGDFVDVPLLNTTTGNTWSVVTVPTGGPESAGSFDMETSGIPYAELRLVGLVVEVVTRGPYFLGLVRVNKFNADGTIPLIYGPQVGLIKQTGGAGLDVININVGVLRYGITGYRRLNVLQLRANPLLNLTQKVVINGEIINTRENIAAPPFNGIDTACLVRVSARCITVTDYLVENRAVGNMIRELPGPQGLTEKLDRLLLDAALGRKLRAKRKKR